MTGWEAEILPVNTSDRVFLVGSVPLLSRLSTLWASKSFSNLRLSHLFDRSA